MIDVPVPRERLQFFLSKLDLSRGDMAHLEPYRLRFAAKSDDFASFFTEYFLQIPQTRIVLEHERQPNRFEKALAIWFQRFFEDEFAAGFLEYLWKSGLKHVEINLDQRYVNLGYAIARQFCHGMVRELVPAEHREQVSKVIDKMLDFCVLVATDSLISATAQCDVEVIRGISHQVRNPVTVIGGNIRRLQKNLDAGNPVYQTYEAIMQENRRLERMVSDVGVYTDIFRREPVFKEESLLKILLKAVKELEHKFAAAVIPISLDLNPQLTQVYGDARDLESMFYYLLENSFEAVSGRGGEIRVQSMKSPLQNFLRIRISNPGTLPKDETMDNLFAPFYSSKPTGTGFGLPIASLAARKNLGTLKLESASEGVLCTIELPSAR